MLVNMNVLGTTGQRVLFFTVKTVPGLKLLFSQIECNFIHAFPNMLHPPLICAHTRCDLCVPATHSVEKIFIIIIYRS